MSEEKPLRDEDYRAMAERARRAEEELARLRADAGAARRAKIAAALVFGAKTLVAVLVLGWLGRAVFRWVAAPNPPPCFFAAQFRYGHDGVESGPWSPWFMWKDTQTFGARHQPVESAGQFKSRDDAWEFIQTHDLPACK